MANFYWKHALLLYHIQREIDQWKQRSFDDEISIIVTITIKRLVYNLEPTLMTYSWYALKVCGKRLQNVMVSKRLKNWLIWFPWRCSNAFQTKPTKNVSKTKTLGWRARRPPPPQLQFRRSRDHTHASIPLAQTPGGLTGMAWLQAGAQRAVIVVVPSFNSLGIDSRNAWLNWF